MARPLELTVRPNADHNEDDIFAVLPLPPKPRKGRSLLLKGPSPPRPSLQGLYSPGDHLRIKGVSFKRPESDDTMSILASGACTSSIHI